MRASNEAESLNLTMKFGEERRQSPSPRGVTVAGASKDAGGGEEGGGVRTAGPGRGTWPGVFGCFNAEDE